MKLYFLYPFMILADIKLYLSYFFLNPYRVVRKFLQRRGEANPHQYGETPIAVIDKLVTIAGGIDKYQYFGDLGAGRGRVCYFINKKYGCRVFAYEQVGVFAKIAKMIFPNVEYRLGNFLEMKIVELDIIYIYGTMMTEKEILALSKRIGWKTKVISISYPLNVYDSRFKTISSCNVKFPWGETKGYVQCLRK